MSFGRLLAHLATMVRNTVRPKAAKPSEARASSSYRNPLRRQEKLDLPSGNFGLSRTPIA